MKTIQCELKKHDYINEVQTIAQMFFPHCRFSFNETNGTENQYKLISIFSGGVAVGEVYENNQRKAVHAVCPGGIVSAKRAVMLSLFHALKKVFALSTPWGALTGIRPSKLVRKWQDEGKNNDEIIKILLDPLCCRLDKARLAVEVARAEKKLAKKINGIGLYVGIPFCPSRCLDRKSVV
jgi:oxygen-independent coproporphyrinogen-3 oxidase